MAISQLRLFKICTWLSTFLSFFRRLICRSGRLRKLSGDQISLPTMVDFSSVPKQPEIEEWSSWDEDGPTSIKIEGGNGNVPPQAGDGEEEEPDYFKDMTPTIRKTQKIVLKKREPLNYLVPDGSAGFSSRLAATQDTSFIQPSASSECKIGEAISLYGGLAALKAEKLASAPQHYDESELGDMDTWHEDANAWEDESSDAAWEADIVIRQQKMAEREKRSMEQQRKKMEKEVQRMMKKDQKIAVKLS